VIRLTELRFPLDYVDADVAPEICRVLEIAPEQLLSWRLYRRGFDARNRACIFSILSVDAEVTSSAAVLEQHAGARNISATPDQRYIKANRAALSSPRPIIIGFGPCGLFAALILAELGYRPLVLERGKAVRERTKDTWGLWRKSVLDPESNVQFGEGGAGTFSDGKLWSQVKDPRHLGRKVLNEFVEAGAPSEILWSSKPHIGTFRLVSMIEKMRAKIERLGGEIRFQATVTDLEIDAGGIRGVTLKNGEQISCEALILAIGHSARDTFEMLHARGVYLEAKPFSIGFRIEHPQSLIDRARFGAFAGNERLGAADYKLVHHCKNGRSVYSFCMCPGGTVVAATSEAGRVVTNGMSQYSRNERNANAGLVVGITPDDFPGGPLAGIAFQRFWESRAYELGGSSYHAPAQLVGDFVNENLSSSLGSVEPSYQPGVTMADLSQAIPEFAVSAIREALPQFERKLAGYSLADAVLTGVETRTSSPVRIRRGDDFMSVSTVGLFPAGEGASYAGGIYSAAIDGIEVAEALVRFVQKNPNYNRPS